MGKFKDWKKSEVYNDISKPSGVIYIFEPLAPDRGSAETYVMAGRVGNTSDYYVNLNHLGTQLVSKEFSTVQQAKDYLYNLLETVDEDFFNNSGTDRGLANYYLNRSISVQKMLSRYNNLKFASIYDSDQFEAFFETDALTILAFEQDVRLVALDRKRNDLVLYTEGDYDILPATKKNIQKVLSTYNKRIVTPAGEQLDKRFK